MASRLRSYLTEQLAPFTEPPYDQRGDEEIVLEAEELKTEPIFIKSSGKTLAETLWELLFDKSHSPSPDSSLKGLAWIFQSVEDESDEGYIPERKIHRERRITITQGQQFISGEMPFVSKRILQIHLAIAKHVFGVRSARFERFFEFCSGDHHMLWHQKVLRILAALNPWLIEPAKLYVNWWLAAATTSLRDNFHFLLEDMEKYSPLLLERALKKFLPPTCSPQHSYKIHRKSLSLLPRSQKIKDFPFLPFNFLWELSSVSVGFSVVRRENSLLIFRLPFSLLSCSRSFRPLDDSVFEFMLKSEKFIPFCYENQIDLSGCRLSPSPPFSKEKYLTA
ncbi:uncharacterized protein LOC135121297 [Zophobas morio]|uniref:uncharacterized protein LOC135121297 n=1 Tax=Zophobas morio TaxID=2755281 RepID=UPI003083B728